MVLPGDVGAAGRGKGRRAGWRRQQGRGQGHWPGWLRGRTAGSSPSSLNFGSANRWSTVGGRRVYFVGFYRGPSYQGAKGTGDSGGEYYSAHCCVVGC
ncbi:hypothetical protein O3P69_002790 [Scylla paramamosain]|uniref:Uncharacterized protein n=1 Tax=Scylla paramamosain TaxID=85552 RepID=A0AAW0UR78_SCYPA